MLANALIQVGLFAILVTVISVPLGLYVARVFSGERTFLDPLLRPGGTRHLSRLRCTSWN